MPRWRVYGKVVGSKYLGEVEAETQKEAEEKGLNLNSVFVSLCHRCSEQCEDPEIHEVSTDRIES